VALPPPAHLPTFPSSPPTILISQTLAACDLMNFENARRLLQLNMEYSVREEGAWSSVIFIIIGTTLHFSNIDESPFSSVM